MTPTPAPFSNVPTQDEIARRQKMAQALMGQAVDASPVEHWTQALARVVKGGVGGMWDNQARQGQQDRQSAVMKALSGDPSFSKLGPDMQGMIANNDGLLNSVAGKVIGNQLDPNAGLRRQLLEAQVQKAQRGPTTDWGKQGAVFQGKDGNFYTVQFASDGRREIKPVATADGTPLEPARGVKTVDDGTGTRVISQASGKDVRRIATDIDGKKTAEAIGTARGKFIVAQPKLEMNLHALDSQNAMAKEEIGLALNDIKSGRVTGWAGLLAPYAPGTSAYALSRRLITLKALVGLDKLGEMRDGSATGASGLGALSEKEMDLLTSVFGSLEQKQDAGTLSRNLKRLERLLDGRVKRLRDAYEKDKRLYGLGRGQGQYTRVPQHGGPVSTIPPPPEPTQTAPAYRPVHPQAVQMLQANPTPETKAQFDEIFGAGAADRVLGGR